jgi:DNA-binding response OmpR family regulator
MKSTAMIIEDDEDLSNIFSEALSAAGFETETVRDGQKAMDRLAFVTPSVVVLDLHLPRVAGMDILNYIRRELRLKDSRVVVTTADARMAETVGEQADFTLVKPISFSQLRDLAARLMPA